MSAYLLLSYIMRIWYAGVYCSLVSYKSLAYRPYLERRKDRNSQTAVCNAYSNLSIQSPFYRPKMKFAKVMFSQVFVCPQGVSIQGRGSLSRECLCQGSSLSGGSLFDGRLCPGGFCPEGSLSRGVSVRRPCTVEDGRYAFY